MAGDWYVCLQRSFTAITYELGRLPISSAPPGLAASLKWALYLCESGSPGGVNKASSADTATDGGTKYKSRRPLSNERVTWRMLRNKTGVHLTPSAAPSDWAKGATQE